MSKSASSTVIRIIILGSLALGLSGCGQKGPLVLPQPTAPEKAEPGAENSQPTTINNEQ